ncbi:MAG: acetyl-CoA carboxylase carboxyl transferase subunit alpha, partial [Aeromonas sp.]|nr:acetyl-CoA carboxylase carboxyl transferase subunit alpha [Aeromonas sp.]
MSLFLDFEQPIAELQAQIDELRHVSEHNSAVDLNEDIRRLEKKNEELTKKIFGDLG